MKSDFLEYQDGTFTLEGLTCYETIEPKPAVIVFHAFRGRDQFACDMARQFGKRGYFGFAADVYGKGVHATTKEESAQLMAPYVENRDVLQKRLKAAYETVKNHPAVDAKRIAAIGFCFGGLCALDLARSGVDLKGVVSFHGLLQGLPAPMKNEAKGVKILACHGYDDPHVPYEQVIGFENEMNQCGVDWQMHIYGQTLHAFTNPAANDREFGTVYNPVAKERAFAAMDQLFSDIF